MLHDPFRPDVVASRRCRPSQSARREWEEGSGASSRRRSDPARADVLHRQLDVVTVELRRRVGGTFTLAELADAYGGAERWLLERGRGARAVEEAGPAR